MQFYCTLFHGAQFQVSNLNLIFLTTTGVAMGMVAIGLLMKKLFNCVLSAHNKASFWLRFQTDRFNSTLTVDWPGESCHFPGIRYINIYRVAHIRRNSITFDRDARSLNDIPRLKRQSKQIFTMEQYTPRERSEIVETYIQQNKSIVKT